MGGTHQATDSCNRRQLAIVRVQVGPVKIVGPLTFRAPMQVSPAPGELFQRKLETPRFIRAYFVGQQIRLVAMRRKLDAVIVAAGEPIGDANPQDQWARFNHRGLAGNDRNTGRKSKPPITAPGTVLAAHRQQWGGRILVRLARRQAKPGPARVDDAGATSVLNLKSQISGGIF